MTFETGDSVVFCEETKRYWESTRVVPNKSERDAVYKVVSRTVSGSYIVEGPSNIVSMVDWRPGNFKLVNCLIVE